MEFYGTLDERSAAGPGYNPEYLNTRILVPTPRDAYSGPLALDLAVRAIIGSD